MPPFTECRVARQWAGHGAARIEVWHQDDIEDLTWHPRAPQHPVTLQLYSLYRLLPRDGLVRLLPRTGRRISGGLQLPSR